MESCLICLTFAISALSILSWFFIESILEEITSSLLVESVFKDVLAAFNFLAPFFACLSSRFDFFITSTCFCLLICGITEAFFKVSIGKKSFLMVSAFVAIISFSVIIDGFGVFLLIESFIPIGGVTPFCFKFFVPKVLVTGFFFSGFSEELLAVTCGSSNSVSFLIFSCLKGLRLRLKMTLLNKVSAAIQIESGLELDSVVIVTKAFFVARMLSSAFL